MLDPDRIKITIILFKLAHIFSLPVQKSNNFQFCDISGYSKGKTVGQQIFPPPLLLLWLDLGSGIQDPGSEIRDPGSGIRDPAWIKIRIRDKHPGTATLLPGTLIKSLGIPKKIQVAKNEPGIPFREGLLSTP